MFQDSQFSASNAMFLASSRARESESLGSRINVEAPKEEPCLIRWEPPPDGWHKCNVDGSVVNSGRNAGCGGAFWDSLGRWLGGFTRNLGLVPILMAELWGILIALQIAWDKRLTSLWIESDSLLAVSALNKPCLPQHSCAAIIHLIQEFLGKDWLVKVSHIKREVNQVVDVLPGMAHGGSFDTVFLSNPSIECSSMLLDDACGIGFPRGFGS